jgi:serine/threonine protein kinase
MDYIEGTTLAERLGVGRAPEERAPLPLAEALDYASQLCDVLVYLHSQQPAVVFGDLKPSNVILTPDGRAVMVDFGVARPSASFSETPSWMWGLSSLAPIDSGSDTQPLGTPGYAAPEQYERGWRADPRSDIFALGVLLHEMVTGHAPPPFPFGFQPVRRFNPALPGALEALIERALSFHPDERFQSARAMSQALHLVAHDAGLPSSQTREIVIPPEIVSDPTTAPLRWLADQRHRPNTAEGRVGAAGSGERGALASLPAAAPRQRLYAAQSRIMLFASAGAAGVLAAITLALLFFGSTGGNHNLTRHAPNQPPAASPTPTSIIAASPLPTARPTGQPSPAPDKAPPPTAAPTRAPEPLPTPTEGLTPTPEEPSPGPEAMPTPQGTPGAPIILASRPGTSSAPSGSILMLLLLAPLVALAIWLKRSGR